jgi:hypothetical protein
MKAESEESATQAMAFIAIGIVTLGLMVMNVSGALAASIGTSPLEMTIRVALAAILAGAELLAAVALVRVMLAPNRLRKVIGSLIFVGLAWACIQNGKRAVHLIYPEFAESSALLEAKASIAGEEAALVATARDKAIEATPEELARVRTEIAAIKAEQQLMASQSPEKIKEAQALLISQGKYFGRVDGLRETLTEAAMRSRGEELAQQLTNLNLREEALAAGAVTAAAGVAAGPNAAVLQADLADRARKAKAATIWLEVMLWVFEAARSFGLWALVTTITARNRRATDTVEAVSDELPAGHARWEGPEEELEAMLRGKEVHENIQRGAKKGARTRRVGTKIEAGDAYYRDKISDWMVAHAEGVPTVAIANGSGMTVAQMRMTYGPHMTPEEHDALFFTDKAKPAEPEPEATEDEADPADVETEAPEPETPVVAEDPADVEPEPEPEPEPPKDWHVALYDPNHDTEQPEDEEAA